MIATLMAGVIPASSHADEPTVVNPPLDPVPFVMSWHRRNDGHPAQRWLREAIASLA